MKRSRSASTNSPVASSVAVGSAQFKWDGGVHVHCPGADLILAGDLTIQATGDNELDFYAFTITPDMIVDAQNAVMDEHNYLVRRWNEFLLS